MIIVFENRTNTLMFHKDLTSSGVPNTLINTPRGITTSCGLSVEVDDRYARIVYNILSRHRYPALYGVFRRIKSPSGMRYVRVSK